MKKSLCLLVSLFSYATFQLSAQRAAVLPNVSYAPSELIEIWSGEAPGETGEVGPERVLPNRPRPFDQIDNVTVPTLSVFLPDEANRTGMGMLVIPGGGLARLAIEHEGYEVAEWLNNRGIAAFLLKYRVPPRDPEQRWMVGLQDAQRSMSIIRSRAEEWGIYEGSIGSIGFSAGAEINVRLSVFENERQYEAIDAADSYSTLPDFNIPIYAGGIIDYPNNALRSDILERLDENTPPMFVVHAFDDGALSSIILMNALKRAKIPSELHIFGAGAHGFGFRESGLPVNDWRELLMNWLEWQGHFDAPVLREFAATYLDDSSRGLGTLRRLSVFDSDASVADAYVAQKRIVKSAVNAGSEIAGYKGAFTSQGSQDSFGVSEAAHGVLFKEGRLDYDGSGPVEVPLLRPTLLETEIGYVMATDIGTKLTVPRQAYTTVEAVAPVIELPTNVIVRMGGEVNAIDIVAANSASDRFIVGVPIDPKELGDWDEISVSLKRDNAELYTSTGAEALGGQVQNLMNLINQIIDQGHVIHRGDIIVSGAIGGIRPLETGTYEADFSELGKIEFSVE